MASCSMADWYTHGKFDIKTAYCNVPVHSDKHMFTQVFLFGMKWWAEYFVDLALPFELRSAPFIFSSTANLLEWVLKNNNSL